MEKIYNLARGTVRLEASGAEPEKLLNMLCDNEIEFWDTHPQDRFSICLTAHSRCLTDIKRLARNNGCEIRILETKGGKALSRSAVRRYALLAGLALCIAATGFSSLFIWNITVIGNENVSYGEVLRALSECGVEYGTYWPAISSDSVKNDILMSFPEISWLSLNMNSSELCVVIHERVEKPDIINEAEPRSLFAQKSGIITNISVLQGKSTVKEGDTVCEGDMLISGIMDSETGEERRVHATGDVTARTWYEITAVSPLTENKKTKISGRELRISLLMGKNNIKFYSDSRNKESSCDKINKLGYISFGKSYVIPIGLTVQRELLYETKECSIDIERTQMLLQNDLLEELRYRIGDGEITSVSFTVSEADGLLLVTLHAECVENIADNRE